jgi:hypothetical protein
MNIAPYYNYILPYHPTIGKNGGVGKTTLPGYLNIYIFATAKTQPSPNLSWFKVVLLGNRPQMFKNI